MNARTRKLLCAAEQAVGRLVEKCHKGDPLYATNPKAVAQVSRTGKWFLNALTPFAQARTTAAPGERQERK
ncbi:MAG TPA: hypothetical protein VEL76_12575 [Gemmataceae bacterium]|nr:hypothetical protein [Gemmataceae bacterium]